MAFVLFLLPSLVTLWQATSSQPPVHFQVVAIDSHGRPHVVSHLRGQAPSDEVAGARSLWVWSEDSAPRAVTPEDFPRLLTQPPAGPTRRLRVRVRGPWEEVPEGLEVHAAPLTMWHEVDEEMLPARPVPPDGDLIVPHDPQVAWRVRLVGPEWGSWWIDVPAGETVVEVVASPARSYPFTVSGPDGKPVAGATLRLMGHTPRGLLDLARLQTGESGAALVPSLPDAAPLRLVLSHPEHVPAVYEGRPGSLPSAIRLRPGGTLRGRVVDQDGAPIARGEVRVFSFVTPDSPTWRVQEEHTDTAGRFEVEAVTRGEVELSVSAPGFAPLGRRLELSDQRLDVGDLALVPGLALPVLVTDEADLPVAGATLQAGNERRASTDATGRARLEGVAATTAAGGVVIQVEAAAHLPAEVRVPVSSRGEALGGDLDEVQVRLVRAFVIRGRFLDAEGRGVAEGRWRRQIDGASRDGACDADGSFEVEAPGHTAFSLVLLSPGTRELRVPVAPGLPGEVRELGDLRAPAGLVVMGRLLRADDAAPVPQAKVWAPQSAAGGPLLAFLRRDLNSTLSRPDGSFRLAGLAAQPTRLRIDAPGLARREVLVRPEEGEAWVDLGSIELAPGPTLRLVVEGEARRATVARLDLEGEWSPLDMLTAPVHDGQAVFDNVAPGKAIVTAFAGSNLVCEERVEVPVTLEELQVSCRGSGLRVRGTVEAGERLGGIGVLVWSVPSAGPPPHSVIWRSTNPSSLTHTEVYTGLRPDVRVAVEDGRFETLDLRPGVWRVTWSGSDGGTTPALDVSLPAAEEFEVVLRFPDYVVRGVVVDEDGGGVAGARVYDFDGGFTLADDDGTFTLAGVRPGVLRLRAQQREAASAVVEVRVEEDRTPEPVRLVLEAGRDQVPLQVLGPAGVPRTGAFVFVHDDTGSLRVLTTDDDGRVAATLSPFHADRLRFAACSEGLWVFTPWLRREDAEAGVTLDIPPSGSILVMHEEEAVAPSVTAPGDWDLTALLTRLGRRPSVTPQVPLDLGGLPPGSYRIAWPGGTRQLQVEAGKTVRVELE